MEGSGDKPKRLRNNSKGNSKSVKALLQSVEPLVSVRFIFIFFKYS